MKITILILYYLFYCFLCFALIYSDEKAKVLKDENAPRLSYFDLVKEDVLNLKDLDESLWVYRLEEQIGPKYHYFLLIREIEEYQSDYEYDMSISLLISFPLFLIAKSIIKLNLIKTWLVFLLCFILGIFTFWLIALACEKTEKFKIWDFGGDDYSWQHYEYLKSIKDTVIFRRFIRKILLNFCWIFYLLCLF